MIYSFILYFNIATFCDMV
uniref:Uncharacterized protein n=1 Tax=Arundo donax TaxID=35708 RepID=A0A0A9CD84_ARUDO